MSIKLMSVFHKTKELKQLILILILDAYACVCDWYLQELLILKFCEKSDIDLHLSLLRELQGIWLDA
jgi:hypothetical protein